MHYIFVYIALRNCWACIIDSDLIVGFLWLQLFIPIKFLLALSKRNLRASWHVTKRILIYDVKGFDDINLDGMRRLSPDDIHVLFFVQGTFILLAISLPRTKAVSSCPTRSEIIWTSSKKSRSEISPFNLVAKTFGVAL